MAAFVLVHSPLDAQLPRPGCPTDDAAGAAAALAWPVRVLDADHLAPMTRPGAVTDLLLALLAW